MSPEELVQEVEKMSKLMENEHPMSKETKQRIYMCFRFAHSRSNLSKEDKDMLAVAIRVLRLF